MKIKSYFKFIKEAKEEELTLSDELKSLLSDDDRDLKEDVLEKIVKSVKSNDKKVVEDFISAYIKDSEGNQIEGLINDSDINEFYLSNRNDINRILSKVEFFDEVPSQINAFSIDDFIIKATKKAIEEILLALKEDFSKKVEGGETTSQTESE